jgi:glyceraldehyde-3-phosphate dehydrogenase/erythrose-4-phosphate dehydrogenase
MKKVNKKGFVLAETITISVVVITTLVVIYTQFISVDNSYYKSFKYNNVNNLYLVNQMKTFIIESKATSLYDSITIENLYLDITDCSSYFVEYMYCDSLIKAMDAKRVIITKYNTTDLSNNVKAYDFSETLQGFIKNAKTKDLGYRLIVEFNDDTIASLKMD